MRGFWQSNTGYLERTCRNDHRLAKMKTERSLMFAYVRLKSLMFAFFEKKYFFPALWPTSRSTQRVGLGGGLFEDFVLPLHQVLMVGVPVFGKFKEGGAAGDEGGVDAQFRGAGVAAVLQFRGATLVGVADAAAFGAERLGLLRSGHGESVVNGLDQ